jgi:catechol 2,3-dioxygenase-like lactoylglutathione lyase family enzyme
MGMFDHTGFTVTDFERSKSFYQNALAPLGIGLMLEVTPEQSGGGSHAGFGAEGRAFFWIGERGSPVSGLHIALRASSREAVDAFHHAALAAGGRDNGAPGLRPHYDDDYYGAFVLDPDGVNVEAVCRGPQ